MAIVAADGFVLAGLGGRPDEIRVLVAGSVLLSLLVVARADLPVRELPPAGQSRRQHARTAPPRAPLPLPGAALVGHLAQALRLEAVADDVEKQAQATRLLELGYHLAQGFYFARPLPAEEIGTTSLHAEAGAQTGGLA